MRGVTAVVIKPSTFTVFTFLRYFALTETHQVPPRYLFLDLNSTPFTYLPVFREPLVCLDRGYDYLNQWALKASRSCQGSELKPSQLRTEFVCLNNIDNFPIHDELSIWLSSTLG